MDNAVQTETRESRRSEVTIPVSIPSPTDPPSAAMPGSISGTLHRPAEPGPKADVIQLLLHGGAYNRTYWDFPYEPDTYNYSERAVGNGYTTLAIDRIGYGKSTQPPSDWVTEAATADTVHQVVQYIRDGRLGHRFSHVVLVGHSMGSIASIQEAGIYQDVDALVITGILHNQGDGMADSNAAMGPAVNHPRFADSGLDEGYLAINPGARAGLFYVPSNTDPRVVAVDEETGDVFPGVEALGYVNEVNRIPGEWQAPHVTVPVLVIEGDHDILGFGGDLDGSDPAAVVTGEQTAYTSSPSLTVHVIPDAGHDLNLQKCAPEVYELIGSWIDQHV